MANFEEINKAIGAHGMWKQRLRQAVDTGKSDFTVERVQPDNICDFGKWLHSLPVGDKGSTSWKLVQGLHAKFHIEAARILDLAVKGKKGEAENSLVPNSVFSEVSATLTSAMMKWKSETK